MGGELFQLVGSIMVDNTQANNSLSETDKKAGGLADKLGKGVATAAKWGAGVAAGATAVGAAVFKMANDAASAMDEIDKGASRMDISKEKYQEFRYVAGQCGVEMSTMEKAAKKLEGTDINFDDAINSIMALTSEEERSAKAAELFGDAVAYQMSPMLAMGGEEMDAMQGRAHELGLVMTDDAVTAGVKLGDTLSDVKQSFGAIGTQLGAELMPIVQKVLDWVLDHMPEIQAAVGTAMEFIKKLIKDLTPVIENLKPVVETLFNGIVILWNTILKPALDGISEFLNGVFTGDWEKAFNGISKVVETVFNGLVNIIKVPLNKCIDLINKFLGGLGSIDIPDWVPVIGGKSFSMPQIPHLASGGTVLDEGSVLVGENGPEMLNLSKGASVVPLGGGAGGNGLAEKLDAMLDMMDKYMPLIGSNIVLNNGKLVGSMAHEMDKELGRLQSGKVRGI